jgi:hypothetical protein
MNSMWWTVVTFAAVATWFEWVYRKERKNPRAGSNFPAETPVDNPSASADSKVAEAASTQDESSGPAEVIAQSPLVEDEPDLGPKQIVSDYSSNSPESKIAS